MDSQRFKKFGTILVDTRGDSSEFGTKLVAIDLVNVSYITSNLHKEGRDLWLYISGGCAQFRDITKEDEKNIIGFWTNLKCGVHYQ